VRKDGEKGPVSNAFKDYLRYVKHDVKAMIWKDGSTCITIYDERGRISVDVFVVLFGAKAGHEHQQLL
jgi:hypothetical protein